MVLAAKLGENFFVGNSLPTALLEPGCRLGNRIALVLALRLVVDGSVCNCAGDGIEETFEHADGRRDLAWRHQLDQFVGVLLVCSHNQTILQPQRLTAALVPNGEFRKRMPKWITVCT